MNDAEQHDGEREVKDRDRRRFTSSTGERPEPTFLITKPFQPETVKAAIGQALFFHPQGEAKAS